MNRREKLWIALIVLAVVVAVIMIHGCGGKKVARVAATSTEGMANNGEDDTSEGGDWATQEETDEWNIRSVTAKYGDMSFLLRPTEDEWQKVKPGEWVGLQIRILGAENTGDKPINISAHFGCEGAPKAVVYYFPTYDDGGNYTPFYTDSGGFMKEFKPPAGAVAIDIGGGWGARVALPVPAEGLPFSDLVLPGQGVAINPLRTATVIGGKSCFASPLDNSTLSFIAQIPPTARQGDTYTFRGTIKLSDSEKYTFRYAEKVLVQ